MKIAVHLARHRRMAGLVVLSLLLHLLAFAWAEGWLSPRRQPAIGSALALRLVPTAAPAMPQQPEAAQSSPVAEPAARAAASPVSAAPAPMAAPVDAAAPAASALPGADRPPSPSSSPAPGPAPIQMPGRYRVRPPPSARLAYTVTRTRPGQPAEPAETAQVAWRVERGSYQLRVEGVLGQLESEGGEDDAGIAPLRASERGAAGGELVARFDREAQRIDYGAMADSAPLHIGSQDRASVLMQLAGIGLAEPDQVQDVIEIVLGGAGGVQVARFQVLGREQLATGAGTLAAVRLLQLAQAGERRVELWLAPQRNWLPVQLRVTEPDGTVANQLVTSIEITHPESSATDPEWDPTGAPPGGTARKPAVGCGRDPCAR
ncbi:MAG: hypothetical protein JWQ80_1526 [Massilia sp.]|nr:hypothetical protein [Massilia sp.]